MSDYRVTITTVRENAHLMLNGKAKNTAKCVKLGKILAQD